ncbi:MAG: DUF3084 domain-containing protein [Armatimonadota bacterium]|nr:DUF3084 domain-containing protein [Armatimonadota bacterium]MDW8024937.1 DUF3084 domain-containing protein [Armatimonadota bacterium]
MHSILLIGALTIASGLIAYIGDVLGRKLGKKRLTIFRLRPRHTAMLISVIAGILIFVTTLTALAAASREVRLALFELDKLLSEREQLRKHLAELRASYHLWKRQAVALSSKLRAEQKRIALVQRQYAQASAELLMVKRQLSNSKSQLQKMSCELARLENKLTESQAQLATTRSELKRADAALKDTMIKLQSSHRELERVKLEIAKANETARRSIAITRKQLDELRRQVDELQATRAELERYRKSLDAYIAQLLFRGDLTYRAEEIVTIGVIDGSMPKEKIMAALEKLLDDADGLARRRGASAQNGERAVKIFGMLIKLPGQEEPVLFTEKDILNVVAENISETNDSVIVEVYAKRNSLPGEQVPIDIRLYRNQLVFKRGEVLTSRRLDGKASMGELMQELASMIYTDLSRIARERGLLMRPDGERPTYGAIPFSEFGNAIEQLKRINGPAIVEALAKRDTFTVGPLEVELRIVPAG